MRLLDSGLLQLREFVEDDVPRYVILSHTWGQEEVTFRDIQDLKKARTKKGFQKIEQCCNKAQSDGFQWVWIDTCCIDKSSSAELSEVINSMYKWYRNSEICYAYLEDVGWKNTYLPGDATFPSYLLKKSRWFKRGWTLQELIAPSIVEFYTSEWHEIGTKFSLLETISERTRINRKVLENSYLLDNFNVASRMSWAADRETTRIEDEAYCLMGLFGVNMPLLYGEGRRAFHRLQAEIMKYMRTTHSLLGLSHWRGFLVTLIMHGRHPLVMLMASWLNLQPTSKSKDGLNRPYSELHTSLLKAIDSMPQLTASIG